MSRKTRKQKQQADIRRHTTSPVFSYTASSSVSHQSKIQTAAATGEAIYIKRDLIKTLIIAIVFISCEFLLAYFFNKSGW